MNKTVTVILILVLIVLADFTYYLCSGAKKCEVMATNLGVKLQECGAGLEICTTQATHCQEALTNLQQVCALYLPTD